MNRSTVKAIGLTMFIAFGLIGLSPFIAQYTGFYDNLSNFTWTLDGRSLLQLTHTADGKAVASAWGGVWFFAIAGELLLIAVNVLQPARKDRHLITHRS